MPNAAVWPELPWVSIREEYLAYDFQRGLLATRRLVDLLRTELDDTDEARHSRQKLVLANDAAPSPREAGAPSRLAIALGGVRSERTYGHWLAVAQGIAARTPCSFTLLGNANARAVAGELSRAGALPAGHDVIDLVERTDLLEARRAMQQADLVLCADGGLMHLALTTTTPLLALFDASVDPAWRLPLDFEGRALRATGRDVSGLAAGDVANAALALLAAPRRPFNGRR